MAHPTLWEPVFEAERTPGQTYMLPDGTGMCIQAGNPDYITNWDKQYDLPAAVVASESGILPWTGAKGQACESEGYMWHTGPKGHYVFYNKPVSTASDAPVFGFHA